MIDVDYRYTLPSDKFYLSKWLENEEMMRWYPPTNFRELKFFVENWMAFAKMEAGLTAFYDGKICGMGVLYLVTYKKVKHHCIMYMAVNPVYSKMGIGRSLMKNMLNLAEKYLNLESLVVEVYEGAPIIKLLNEFNFTLIAEQKNYVKMSDKTYLSRKIYEHFF